MKKILFVLALAGLGTSSAMAQEAEIPTSSRQTNTEKSHPLYNTLNSHVDVLINASNLVCGYNENRVWNLIPYVGIGEIHNFDNGNDNLSLQAGLLNNFRINDRLQFFADLKVMGTDGDFDGAANDKWVSYGQTHLP